MKTFLTSLFILATIYLFAESNPTEEFNTITKDAYKVNLQNPKTKLPAKPEQLFAINNAPAPYVPVKQPVTATVTNESAPTARVSSKEKIRIYPNARDGELWVETDGSLNGTDIEIYNNAGQPVYKTKLAESFHKVDLCSYQNGKYLIKVGAQTYRLMVIN